MDLAEARAKLNDREWVTTATREEYEAVYIQVQEADIAAQFGRVVEAATGPGGYSGATNVPRPGSP